MLEEFAASIVQEINRSTGRSFSGPKRTPGGESASTFVVSEAHEKLLLKIESESRVRAHRRGARVCEHLSRRHYPVPRTVAMGVLSGHAYSLHTWLQGEPMAPDDGSHVERLLSLVELHTDAARLLEIPPDDWPGSIVDPVLVGGPGFCLLETMREHSEESAQLLTVLQSLVVANRLSLQVANDIIHYDYNPANILVDAGEVTGVVDWEGVRAGDRAFDLVTLLFYTYDAPQARERIWARLDRLRPRSTIAVYLAHIILRQVEWSLRLHSPALGQHYLNRARAVLRDLRN